VTDIGRVREHEERQAEVLPGLLVSVEETDAQDQDHTNQEARRNPSHRDVAPRSTDKQRRCHLVRATATWRAG
jgi:hypothetical protein